MTFSAFISWYSHAANLSWSMSNEIFLDWVLLNYGQKKEKNHLNQDLWIVPRNLSLMILSGSKNHGLLLSLEINSGSKCGVTLPYELIPLNIEVYQFPPCFPTRSSSYAMGKLLVQHLQNIITVLFHILLLES